MPAYIEESKTCRANRETEWLLAVYKIEAVDTLNLEH